MLSKYEYCIIMYINTVYGAQSLVSYRIVYLYLKF